VSDESIARLAGLIAAGMSRLGVSDLGDYMELRAADSDLAHYLLVVPSGDAEVDAHSVRSASPRRLLDAVLRDDEQRLAARLYANRVVESVEDGEVLLDRLLGFYAQGLRP
jgi:hypothetical protein